MKPALLTLRLSGLRLWGLALLLGSGAAWAAAPVVSSADMQATLRTLEARVARIEANNNQSARILGLLQEVEQLREELARLRGESEVNGHKIDQLGQRQTDLYTDIDARLSELKPAPAPAAPPAGGTRAPTEPLTAVPGEPATTTAAAPADEASAYDAALGLFRAGNYPDAITRFRAFLRDWPQSALASNAQYWVGHAFYALKDYRTALAQHQNLLVTYPNSNKVPDTLLNMAACQLQLGDIAAARASMEKLIAEYPATNAAALAQKRLALLK